MTYSPEPASFADARPIESASFSYRRRHGPSLPDARRHWRVFVVAAAAVGVFALVMLVFGPLAPARANPTLAREQLAASLDAFKRGHAGEARARALDATRADPDWGLAHAVLARMLLTNDDGIGAEGELNRARDTGFDPARVRQLYAHAYLLQGDTARAITEADQATPRFARYAARIRARALAAQGDGAAARAALSAVVAKAPGDAAAWIDLGRLRLAGGDQAGAIVAAARAVALAPTSADALVLRGIVVRNQFGLVGALPWFETALRHDPGHHDALIEYAATLGEVGRTRDMLAAARRAEAVRPGSPQALFLQAVLAARAGSFDLSRSLYQRTGGALDAMPAAMLLGGTLAFEAGANEQAIEKLRALVGTQPMNIAARKLLAAALMRSGDAQGALDILRPVALRGDADSYVLGLVARGFEAVGDRGMATRFLDRAAYPAWSISAPFGADDSLAVVGDAAARAPGDPAPGVELVRGLIDARKIPEALARAQALVQQNPGAAQAQLILGDTLAVAGRLGDAGMAYKRAANIRFDEPTMLRLVDALDRSGRRGEAANVLALFLSQNPENIAALRLTAHWQIAAGEWDAAIDILEGLRARVGNRDAALLAELALAKLGAGDAAAAEPLAASAYRLAPANPAVIDAYGWVLRQRGDQDGAIQLLEKAVTIAPRHGLLRWHLAQAYADAGRGAAAQLHARAALADPSFADRDAAKTLAGQG